MLKHYRRTFTALLTIFALSAICASWSLSAPPEGKGKPPKDDGGGSEPTAGTVYFRAGLQYSAMNADGSLKTALPLFDEPGDIEKEPSHALHGGRRWFLEVREVGGAAYPDGGPRVELFAVSDDGASVQLTDLPELEIGRSHEFFARWTVDAGLDDGVVSWAARRWDGGTVVDAGIYDAQIDFDADGNVTGLVAQPNATEPLLGLDLVEFHYDGIVDDPDILGFDWSPDGTALVYATWSFDVRPTFIFDLVDSENLLMTGGWDPEWSPDGTQIAFTSFDGVEKIAPDGSGRVIVVSNAKQKQGMKNASSPHWSPGGGHLVYKWWNFSTGGNYVNRTDVFRVASDGSAKQNLTKDLESNNYVVGWR